MKRIVIFALALAALLIAGGLLLRHHDPSTPFDTNREAWQAYQEGHRLRHSYRFNEAEEALQRAIALDPDLAPAHAALADIYMLFLGHPEHSKVHLALADSLAEKIGDKKQRILLQLGLSRLSESRFHAQRDSLLDLARVLAPREIDVLFSKALQAEQEMDYDRAEDIWQEILTINPNYAEAYNRLGYLHLHQGRHAEAEASMRRYAFVAPDLANPHDSLGEVLLTVGRYEEAEREFLRALDKQEDFYFSQLNLARLYLARGQIQKTVDLIEVLLALFSGTALEQSFEHSVAYLFFNHRLSDLFATYATRFLSHVTDPGVKAVTEIDLLLCRPDAMAALARLDSLQADHDFASRLSKESMSSQRYRTQLLRQRAQAAEQLGLHEAATELLKQILEHLQPVPPHITIPVRVHLAYNLIPLGRFDEARVQIRQVLEINPRLAEGLLVAAGIETAAGRHDDALRLLDTLEQTLRLSDEDFPALLDARRLREELDELDHI
jgi:tetratricopeptide (TPR) repeat protein